MRDWAKLQTPDLQDWEAILLDENIGNVNGTAFDQIHADPRLADDQMASLAALRELSETGMSDVDRFQLAQMQNQSAAADRGRREAILQNMQQRGQGGSGMELLAQLQSSQDATSNANMQGLGVAAQAQANRQNAMMNRGQLAGQVRGQQFGEQASKAQAKDAINQFNAQNRMNVGMQNNQSQNQAGFYNTAQKPQQNFDNQMAKTAGQTGAYQQYAEGRQRAKDRQVDMFGNMMGGASTMVAGGMMSDERLKKDIKPISDADIEEFLNAVTPRKYRYKDEKHGEGQRVGFMAQDVQDTNLGQHVVKDSPEGHKEIDINNLLGVLTVAAKRK
ncbi:MAG: tail fiber domain-containing protein [Oligoflexus sp.]